MRRAPFLGRGLAFPFRLDPVTGGLQITEGTLDPTSVGIEYVPERFSVREALPTRNHIAEAMEHILLVTPGEHDTLPEFGSRLFAVIHDPNNWVTEKAYETWIQLAVARWEQRASVPNDGVAWANTPDAIDEGESRVRISPQVIGNQVPQNLVAPFVSPRQQRAQEYPVGDADTVGHDWASRHHGATTYTIGGATGIRPRKTAPVPESADDQFYEVKHGDTWLLISFKIYGDIRFWWIVADAAVNDAAAEGASRELMDTCGDPEPGTLLRLPSRTKLLMEMAA